MEKTYHIRDAKAGHLGMVYPSNELVQMAQVSGWVSLPSRSKTRWMGRSTTDKLVVIEQEKSSMSFTTTET